MTPWVVTERQVRADSRFGWSVVSTGYGLIPVALPRSFAERCACKGLRPRTCGFPGSAADPTTTGFNVLWPHPPRQGRKSHHRRDTADIENSPAITPGRSRGRAVRTARICRFESIFHCGTFGPIRQCLRGVGLDRRLCSRPNQGAHCHFWRTGIPC